METPLPAFTVTLKNYRCFSDESPVRLETRGGYLAFVGMNKAGKSSLLKVFYEFRPLFQNLSNGASVVVSSMRQGVAVLSIQGVTDMEEVYCNAHTRPLEIDIAFDEALDPIIIIDGKPVPALSGISICLERQTNLCAITWLGLDAALMGIDRKEVGVGNAVVLANGQSLASITAISTVLTSIADTLYIGSFRNAINSGRRPPPIRSA